MIYEGGGWHISNYTVAPGENPFVRWPLLLLALLHIIQPNDGYGRKVVFLAKELGEGRGYARQVYFTLRLTHLGADAQALGLGSSDLKKLQHGIEDWMLSNRARDWHEELADQLSSISFETLVEKLMADYPGASCISVSDFGIEINGWNK